ncbi:MAG: monovalent cation/H+ antiporter subunit E [Haloferacaceae archaeon]
MPVEGSRVLVPVKDTATLRNTVAYAVEQADQASGEDDPELHFVYFATWRNEDPGAEGKHEGARRLLDRTRVWASYDFADLGYDTEPEGDEETEIVRTAVVGAGSYLFSVEDYADVLAEYAETHGIETVVMDPEYSVIGRSTLHQPLDFELEARGVHVEEAPVDRPTRRERLVREVSAGRFLFVFGLSYLFYLVLGGFSGSFDLLTGAVSAAVVAAVLSGISLDHDPTFPETPLRILRGAIYLPVLFVEILKSNVVIASVILRPSMPIEPRLTRMRAYLGPGVQITTLANSITLTPGTLTVRARDQDLYVHTLVPWAREGLFAGSLERWVRFVFYGRQAARLASPEERGDTEILQGRDVDEPAVETHAGRSRSATPSEESDEGEQPTDGETSTEEWVSDE